LAALDVALTLVVAFDDGVPVWLTVALRLAVTGDEGVAVSVGVEVPLAVSLDVSVPVTLEVALRLAVALDEGVPVAIGGVADRDAGGDWLLLAVCAAVSTLVCAAVDAGSTMTASPSPPGKHNCAPPTGIAATPW
jgi:hypothetical protein